MPTAHWQFASYDLAFTTDTVFPDLDIVIPAGATLKRFLAAECYVTGRASGNNIDIVRPMKMLTTVSMVGGPYAGQVIYEAIRVIPQQIVALWDGSTLERIYDQWILAGDKELGFNQKCSYGTAIGPGFIVRCKNLLYGPPGTFGAPVGQAVFVFRTLHIV